MAEHQLGRVEDLLQDGGMQRLELEGKPVILARVAGEYHAFGGNCSHYGAPLDEGVLKEHTIICPWHHACFDIRSGLRLEPPALNNLPRYPVRVEAGMVTITLPHDNPTQPQGKADSADARTFVIVGGGAAGGAAAEELRQAGFTGQIVLVSAAPTIPLDRPNLSKDYLDGHAEPEWIPLRSEDWYAERDIELRLGAAVTGIDVEGHQIHMHQGEPIAYSKLLLATGALPRQLRDVPGTDLDGVYTLRSLADADRIIQAAEGGKRAVVIGASFIGLEVAASLASGRGVSVTVVAPEEVPFDRLLGVEVGRMFQQEHENNGVQFRLGDGVVRMTGQDGRVSRVELKSGETLDADFVVVGIGVVPATDFLRDSGLALHERDHSVRVDRHLRASHPDVYAAGDIARWDDGSPQGVRIEHWRVAQQQGLVAAHSMLGGDDTMHQRVPFFWTSQWKITLRYVGHAAAWDEIIFWGGTPAQKQFIAFYVQDGHLQAATGCGYDRELDAVELILRHQMPLTPAQMRDPGFDLIAYARGNA
jgi:NADPH-dependent 2,4-dienoyl-CoA reductase/sulfur reductase-like enzyme/nitrite reductase/ring-hydroxylating ferredoxin subunit